MYKLLFALLMTVGMTTAMCAQQKQKMNSKHSNSKILVAYFSATGTTARAAEKLGAAVGADLDWNNKRSRSSVEMNDPKMRPAIKSKKENIGTYDVVFIGYPIWWDLAPRIINTFIESHSLKGKTVVPFATSGGSSIGNSATVLKKTYPDLNWKEGRLLNRTDEKAIRAWLDVIAVK